MTLWAARLIDRACAWQIGAVCLPMPGEIACGDAWAVGSDRTVASLLLADGLGHGPHAAEASEAAASIVDRCPAAAPGVILQQAHHALRATRGAAVASARLDSVSKEMHFAGVGNIAACVFDGNGRRPMVSHNGIVGSNMRKVQEFAAPWSTDSFIIMHSDGLGTRWDLGQYPGLAMRPPSLIAAVLYRDFARKRDDVTVLVVRKNLSN
jgi:hypothetical protein